MLLILTASDDVTADYLCERLARDTVPWERLDTDRLTEQVTLRYRLGQPVLRIDDREYSASVFQHVWFRRPGVLRVSEVDSHARASHCVQEWTEAIEGFVSHIPVERWMNHPSRNACASHKVEQLTRAVSIGLSTPKTLLTQDEAELKRFWEECGGQVIVKPLSGGYIDGDDGPPSLVYTSKVTSDSLTHIAEVRRCPTLFQELVPKQQDVRVTVVDDEVVAIGLSANDEDGAQRLDIRRHEMRDVTYAPIRLPRGTESKVRQLVRSYELRFAAVDMAVCPNGDWVFFELNPNGQWAWLDLEAGMDLAALFTRSFMSRSQ